MPSTFPRLNSCPGFSSKCAPYASKRLSRDNSCDYIVASFGIGFLVAAAFLLILTAIKFVEIGYLILSSHGARLGSVISGLWGQDSFSLERFGDEQNRKGFAVIGDLAGGFTLLLLCMFLGFGELALQTKLVKWVAYYEDSLPATSYPGLDAS